MSGRYTEVRPDVAAARRFVVVVALSAVLTAFVSALIARKNLVHQGTPLLPLEEWVEILAFTIFAYLTPIYGTFAWIANRLLRQTQARHLSFAATDLYGALLFMSIGVGYSLLTLFQEQTVFPPLLGLFLFYMLIYAVLGAFAGAVVISTIAKSLGYPKR